MATVASTRARVQARIEIGAVNNAELQTNAQDILLDVVFRRVLVISKELVKITDVVISLLRSLFASASTSAQTSVRSVS